MAAPEIIGKLVKRFEQNHEQYRSPKYNETTARQEFIDPFFRALGWDIYNEQGLAQDYRDVILEDSLEVEGATKAPDYAFRVGRERKFFVEAKKPAVNLEMGIHAAFQVRRYAWSAKLPLSILTDFEEFAVYDCRVRPDKTDKASVGRVGLYGYRGYVEQWDEIAGVFSKDAVLRGSFDKYAEGVKGKRGTAEVDDAFLTDIEGWRLLLAKNIALRNPIGKPELNYAVQMTLDRIIFLRICEDRGIEPYGQLQRAGEHEDIYPELRRLFQVADARYDSGLFHFKDEKGQASEADGLTLGLTIDDKALQGILKNLYAPDCPYVFSVIPTEILGQVYEQFLGKVIRLTAGHQAKVEEKPEVRKAGGVYYTPTYIVDYIVKNTLGKMLEGKTPADVARLKVLDPACGSGSFLLGAFQCLLDWHLRWYSEHEPQKWAAGKAPAIFELKDGWRLTTARKKEILLNNLHGVDIDAQAVEVTKLSLLLKVLEGESQETSGSQLRLLQERVLPDLGNNIKCGNSLIGPDYFEGHMMVDEEERQRVNAFDWKAEFPQVFVQGGFDVVIGNPPWGAEFTQQEQEYIRGSSEVGKTATLDSYALFIERGVARLRDGGFIGLITPDTFLRKPELLATRSLLLNNTTILNLVETGPLFSKVRDTWCLVFTASKQPPKNSSTIRHLKLSRFITAAEERLALFGRQAWTVEGQVPQAVWRSRPSLIVGYSATEAEQSLVAKIEAAPSLAAPGDRYRISRGEEGNKFSLSPHASGKFFMVIPADIDRYALGDGIRVPESTLTPTKVSGFYQHPKIWIVRIQKMRWRQRIVCVFDERANSAGMKTLQLVVSQTDDVKALKYLSGILSSKVINFWCVNYLADDMNQSYLSRIPVPIPDGTVLAQSAPRERMVSLVDRMVALHKQSPNTPQEKEAVKREIEATDHQIDRLAYELYGLTEEEIRIVEGA